MFVVATVSTVGTISTVGIMDGVGIFRSTKDIAGGVGDGGYSGDTGRGFTWRGSSGQDCKEAIVGICHND
jgi:hypothetical protein